MEPNKRYAIQFQLDGKWIRITADGQVEADGHVGIVINGILPMRHEVVNTSRLCELREEN